MRYNVALLVSLMPKLLGAAGWPFAGIAQQDAPRSAGTKALARYFACVTAAREASMAGGWTRDGAVQDQIDDTVLDAVLSARARMPSGESALHCDDCGEDIPERRRLALTGTRTCISCQAKRDAKVRSTGINRRGSKDSQLR
jgi:phage/conjugal plasmid C-4 type zinc finger TraR family protein